MHYITTSRTAIDFDRRARRVNRRAGPSSRPRVGVRPAVRPPRPRARGADLRRPDFLEQNRAEAREAVFLTTTVDVPHAGLP